MSNAIVNNNQIILYSDEGNPLDALTPKAARALSQQLLDAAFVLETGRITERTRAWYFGVWNDVGHDLHHIGGSRVRYEDPYCPAQKLHTLDGGWAPRHEGQTVFYTAAYYLDPHKMTRMGHVGGECPQGQFLFHRYMKDGSWMTLLAWWDRTHGDKRGSCNSVYIVEGEFAVSEMLAWWPKHFPLQAKHLKDAGVELVQVHASV
jgi:hypothetical protein